MINTFRLVAAALVAVPFASALAGDREPTPDERTTISDVLYSEGFTSWGKIEFDDGEWEVENVVDQDGRVRDLKLDSAFVITSAEEDDDKTVKVRVR